jgi:hypothetical protein
MAAFGKIPNSKKITCIGPVTEDALASALKPLYLNI